MTVFLTVLLWSMAAYLTVAIIGFTVFMVSESAKNRTAAFLDRHMHERLQRHFKRSIHKPPV